MMYSTTATLDGQSCGIAAYSRSKNGWISRSDGRTNLFTNFKSLDAMIIKEGLDYHDVFFYFIIQDKITGKATLSLADSMKVADGEWKCFKEEEIYGTKYLHVYNISEKTGAQVSHVGYISTKRAGTHGPNNDAKFEYQKLKETRNMIYEAANSLAMFQSYGCSVNKIPSGIDVIIDNTTARIHIWTLGKLMDYNTDIKKSREGSNSDIIQDRCLPFTPGMDKYGAMYMFATLDESDFNDDYIKSKIDMIEECLIIQLQDMYPNDDVRYQACQYTGKVMLNHNFIRR